jgi:sporulation protein YlmC with PRC-barrel domain
MRLFITTMAACALVSPLALTAPAAAQTTQPQTTQPMAQGAPQNMTQWRASKMDGVDVYNQDNQKLGEIEDVLIDPSGRVTGVVLSVGGFLGIDEHEVLIPMDRLRFSSDTSRSTTGSGRRSAQWYPERATLNITKEQLQAMPRFRY